MTFLRVLSDSSVPWRCYPESCLAPEAPDTPRGKSVLWKKPREPSVHPLRPAETGAGSSLCMCKTDLGQQESFTWSWNDTSCNTNSHTDLYQQRPAHTLQAQVWPSLRNLYLCPTETPLRRLIYQPARYLHTAQRDTGDIWMHHNAGSQSWSRTYHCPSHFTGCVRAGKRVVQERCWEPVYYKMLWNIIWAQSSPFWELDIVSTLGSNCCSFGIFFLVCPERKLISLIRLSSKRKTPSFSWKNKTNMYGMREIINHAVTEEAFWSNHNEAVSLTFPSQQNLGHGFLLLMLDDNSTSNFTSMFGV